MSERPRSSNADEWRLFLSEYVDSRATSVDGLSFVAVQIAEALDAPLSGPIWVRTIGERVQVLVERAGVWRLVIDEDRNGAISHIAEPPAIAVAPADEVTAFRSYEG